MIYDVLVIINIVTSVGYTINQSVTKA